MMSELAGDLEFAMVTGAASGIGAATAERLAARGAVVGLVDRDPRGLREVQARLGSTASVFDVDICDVDQLHEAVRTFGDLAGRIDTVVAAAGIAMPGRVDQIDWDVYLRGLAVNVTGVVATARATLPFLRLSDRASFVAVASESGLRGAQGWPTYSATKHAVVGLVRSMAADHGPEGIRVNAVCPGWVDTPLMDRELGADTKQKMRRYVPLGRIGTPANVAGVIAHLTSTDAAHTTGMAYLMDGGESAASYRDRPRL